MGSKSAVEARLVARAQAGDADAFVELCEPIRDKLIGVCWLILHDVDDAEDAYQATLLAAWQQLERFEARSSWSTWVVGIGRNTALQLVRKRKRELESLGVVGFGRGSTWG